MTFENDNEKLEFDFEPLLRKYIGELNIVRRELSSTRAESETSAAAARAAETALGAERRAAAAARAECATAGAAAAHAAAKLTRAQDALALLRMQLDVTESERATLCGQLEAALARGAAATLERDEARSALDAAAAGRSAARDLHQRTQAAVLETQQAVQRLESELRRVERAADAGAALRERARLAAAAHARSRARAQSDLRNVREQLLTATEEICRLRVQTSDRKCECAKARLADDARLNAEWGAAADELRAQLAAERAGAAQLAAALDAALRSNAQLLAEQAAGERNARDERPEQMLVAIDAVDMFLAD